MEPDYEADMVIDKKKVDFYFWFFKGLKNLVGDKFIIPTIEYKKFIKKFNDKSINALSRHGLTIEENNDNATTVIKNIVYPKMFTAMKEVIKAGYSNYKVNCDSFFIACDFRALANYKRTYKDLFSALSDKNRLIAQKLHQYAVENNAC